MNALPANCDLLVVGGGINGAGIARDAAGRGLSVILCEQDDLAAHTSSASTKLIHGGLRYLEQLDFSLVRKALMEREVLIAAAPHIIWPLRFIMPHDAHLRPAWMIRAGLFLYDHLARRRYLPGSSGVDLRRHRAGSALQARYRRGFVYSDAWADDARLVVLNALDAHERGAHVLTRTQCTRLVASGGEWIATLVRDSRPHELRCRAVVNAAGPWAARFLHEVARLPSSQEVRLVKGSHIAVPRMFAHSFAYIFQNPDRRVLFAIPYERDFTLIGTTDLDYHGDPGAPAIDAAEIEYLCAMANQYFRRPLNARDVRWSYSGVRPLLDDRASSAQDVTRDYRVELSCTTPPLLSIFGGKLTVYRRVAEEALAQLTKYVAPPRAAPWTARAPLPGGDIPGARFADLLRRIKRRYPFLPAALRQRLCRTYGTRAERLLGDAQDLAALGEEVLPQLYAAEVQYLLNYEWAQTAEDILWRRTKLGLHMPPDSAVQLSIYLGGIEQPCNV